MTALEHFLDLATVHRLGWVLVHSLWQLAMAAALLAGLLWLLRRASAGARYLAGCGVLALMAALPAGTYCVLAPGAPMAAGAALVRPGDLIPAATPWASDGAVETIPSPLASEPSPPAVWHVRAMRWIEPRLPAVVAAWLAGVLVLSLRMLGGWLAAQRLRRRAVATVAYPWRRRMAGLARRMGIRRSVRLVQSQLAAVPTVIGHLRPVILLPVCVLTGLAPQQVEAILAHELAHIRRNDYLVNLVQVFVETVLFYHPAVWWVSRRIRVERENACDDDAIAACGDRLGYIRALVSLEEMRETPVRLAVAWQGASLLERVRRLVGTASPDSSYAARWAAGPVMVVLLAGVLAMAVAAERSYAQKDGDAEQKKAQEIGRLDRPHWQRFVRPRAADGQGSQSQPQQGWTLAWPKECEVRSQGDAQGRQVLVEARWITAASDADIASLVGAIGKDPKARVAAAHRLERSRLTVEPKVRDGMAPAILTDEQVQWLLAAAEASKAGRILTAPRVTLRDRQQARIEVGTQISWPVAEQSGPGTQLVVLPCVTGNWFEAKVIGRDRVKLDFVGRAIEAGEDRAAGPRGRVDEPKRDRLGHPMLLVTQDRVGGAVELESGTTLLVRVPSGYFWAESCRYASDGDAGTEVLEVFFEPAEVKRPLGAVYLLIRAEVRAPAGKREAAPVDRVDADLGLLGPTGLPVDAARRLVEFPMDARREDVIAAFGKPRVYRDGSRILDENVLPDAYCMDYGNGFMVWMSGGRVEELRLEGETPPEMQDFTYQGRLRLGSSLEDVLTVMGPPDRTVEGGQAGFAEGVLYKNVERFPGAGGRYTRYSRGPLRVALYDNEVKALYLRRLPTPSVKPRLDAKPGFEQSALQAIEQVAIGRSTRDQIVEAFGKPTRYWWQRDLEESGLPQAYLMEYPGGLTFLMKGHRVQEVRIEGGQTRDPLPYAFRGSLRVGSPVQDALNVLGPPTRVASGEPIGFEDGVLYKDAPWQGHTNVGYYSRADQGVRLFLVGDKVLSIYLTRTEPAADPVRSAETVAKLGSLDLNKATVAEVVNLLGRPAGYGSEVQDYDEANLPGRYLMHYPDGVKVAVEGEQVTGLWFWKPTIQAYRGLRVGSTWQEVQQAMGEPVRREKAGQASFDQSEDGVLYTDCEGLQGQNRYMRRDLGLSVVMMHDRVVILGVTRTQAASQAGQ